MAYSNSVMESDTDTIVSSSMVLGMGSISIYTSSMTAETSSMQSYDTNSYRLPSMRDRGNNMQHMMNHMTDDIQRDQLNAMNPMLADHSYARIGQHTNDPPQSPVYVFEPQTSEIHQDITVVQNDNMVRNSTVYGTPMALREFLDNVEKINRQPVDFARYLQNIAEGVLLSRSLQLQLPGRYLENQGYSMQSNLGSGTFGSVFQCVDLKFGTIFACKTVSVSKFRRQEVEVLVQLRDTSRGARCLPEIYGVLLEGSIVKILMEFVDMTWLSVVSEHKRVNERVREELVVDLLRQALYGIRHLQRHKICHCDIKPDNLGYNQRGQVKILDFGTVRLPNEEFSHCGMTGHYMPPEACRRIRHYNSDTWSLACATLYLINHSHPWLHVSKDDQRKVVTQITAQPEEIQVYVRFAQQENGTSQVLVDLLNRMLKPNPDERIDAEKALQHSIFTIMGDNGGTVSSIGAINKEVPAVVPSQGSEPRQSMLQEPAMEQGPPNGDYQSPQGRGATPHGGYQIPAVETARPSPTFQLPPDATPKPNVVAYHLPPGTATSPNQIQGYRFPAGKSPGVTSHLPPAPGANMRHQLPPASSPNPNQGYQLPLAAGPYMGLQLPLAARPNMGYQLPLAARPNMSYRLPPVSSSNPNQGHQLPPGAGVIRPMMNQLPAGAVAQMMNQLTGMGIVGRGGGGVSDSGAQAMEEELDVTDGTRSSLELPIDLSQPAAMKALGQETHLILKPIQQTTVAESGYNSNNHDVSIELIFEDRVENFRVPQNFTVEDIWQTLREKAQHLTRGIRNAVAIYEGGRKLDSNIFREVLLHDRQFTLVVMKEN